MKQLEGVWSSLQEKRSVIERLLLLTIVVFAVTLAMTSVVSDFLAPVNYAEGEVAKHSVRAPRDFMVEDLAGTAERRAKAAATVKKVFTLDDSAESRASGRLKELLADVKESAVRAEGSSALHLSDQERARFERRFRINLVDSEWDVLLNTELWPELETAIVSLVEPVAAAGIVKNRRVVQNSLGEAGSVIRHKVSNEEHLLASNEILDVKEAVEAVRTAFPAAGFNHGADFDSLVRKIAESFLQPNLSFDTEETENRMRSARNGIDPVYYKVRQGETIVRAGDLVTPLQERRLRALQSLQGTGSFLRLFAGYFTLSALILVSAYLFTSNVWPNFKPSNPDLVLMAVTLVGSMLLLKLNTIVGGSLSFSFPDIDKTAFVLLTPVAAGGILLQVTLGAPAVFIFVLTFALLSGIYLEDSWIVLLLIVLGNVVGAVSVTGCSRRSSFLSAGARVALVNLAVVFTFFLLYPQFLPADNAARLLCAVGGGLISGVVAAGLTPVAEYIGSYITDIKLLELASLDRPLLRDLSVQAPGTWNHSMVMGQMGEAAAEAVGANAMLCRVGAYYHDIGKIKKPAYFIENQSGKDNRHDKLTPSMSALIIKTHVKDGIEMARHNLLPERIIDLIPQHHGTALIEYFYEKALKEAADDEVVDETHYRYPGPKPQTKEAGIIMLADSVEAASRTLSDPSPAKIQGLVQKIINKIFISGQLDECELTLKDLHLIAKKFTRVLTGIFHRRVEYSEPAEKVREVKAELKAKGEDAAEPLPLPLPEVPDVAAAEEQNGKKETVKANGDGNGSKRPADKEGTPKKAPAANKEALKRLGM